MADTEIPIPKLTIAILVVIFGSVFLLCSFLSYYVLYSLEWVSWGGVFVCLGTFAIALVLLTTGWIWLRVLRG